MKATSHETRNLERPDRTLVELLRFRADHHGDELAYRFLEDGERESERLSYGELELRVRKLASVLGERFKPGERVLLLFPHGIEILVGFFACVHAGMVPLPAPPPDPQRLKRTLSRYRSIVADASAVAVLTTEKLNTELAELREKSPELAAIPWLASDDDAGDAAAWRDPERRRDDLAYIQYTSGSTSTPKGVMLTHHNLLSGLAYYERKWIWTESTGVVNWMPYFHDWGLIEGMLQPLFSGVPCTLMSPLDFLKQPRRWLAAIGRYGASHSSAPPFAYDFTVKRVAEEERSGLDLSSWRMASIAAEKIYWQTLERFHQAFASHGFRFDSFYPTWGLAEATLYVTGKDVTGKREPDTPRYCVVSGSALEQHRIVEAEDGAPGAVRVVDCGIVEPPMDLRIVDPESREPCGEDRVGELWVAGPAVGQGYWQRADATAETFQGYLANGDGPFLRTGDLGFLRGGHLFFGGRLKDVIIVHGTNHYPQDIELTVEESHPAIRLGCTAAFAVEVGEGERLALVVELKREVVREEPGGEELDAIMTAIAEAILERHDLQLYAVHLLKPGSILKAANGKVQRSACRKAFIEGKFQPLHSWSTEDRGAQPEDQERASDPETAARLAAWLRERVARQAKVAASAIDVDEPFARYGFDSAAAISLIGELEGLLGKKLSPTLVYRHSTVARLSRHLAGDGDHSPTLPRSSSPPNPLSMAGEGEPEILPPPSPAMERGVGGVRTSPAGRSSGLAGRSTAASRSRDDDRVAIIGLGCRLPGAPSPESFWRLMIDGVDAISEVPRERWDVDGLYDPDPDRPGKMSTRWGGFLPSIDGFDAGFFGISRREAAHMDPQQRLLLEVAWEALEDAGVPPRSLGSESGASTGVFMGLAMNDYAQLLLRELEASDAYVGTGSALSIAANRISYLLDLQGPSLVVDTACSSSLVAVHLACRSLRDGECEVALAGGVNLIVTPAMTVNLSKAGFMAPDGRCKAFDHRADGFVRSEGAGVVVLKPLTRALADGDRIYAVIRGSAVNQDGRGNGLTAPNPAAQEAMLREAYRRAGVAPRQVAFVETHGTGTALGDPIEVGALTTVLAPGRGQDERCVLGAVKTNVGHLEAAAGIAGLIKTALVMERGAIPPNLHLTQTNAEIPFAELPFDLPRGVVPWPRSERARYAGVSSFGFGGTNAHVVLEEAPTREPSGASRGVELLPISARSTDALEALSLSLGEHLAGHDQPLADVAFTLACGRQSFAHRAVAVGSDAAALADQLRDPSTLTRGEASREPCRVAFLFPGQGALEAGATRALYESEAEFRRWIDRGAELLVPFLELDLRRLLYAGDDELAPWLEETALAQPILFVTSYAMAELWRSWGVEPAAMLGHSVGEYVAACLAGVLSFEDAVQVVAKRGRLMQEQPPGAMLAVPLAEGKLGSWLDDELAVAALNAPGRSVIAGPVERIEDLAKRLREAGIVSRRLRTSHAFHSPMMEGVMAPLADALRPLRLAAPRIPYISSTTGDWVRDEQATAVGFWARQARAPVRFADGVVTLLESGVDVLLEVGIGNTLSSLARRPVSRWLGGRVQVVSSLPEPRTGADVEALLRALGKLWTAGVEVDWGAFYQGQNRHRVALPTTPFERSRCWVEAPTTVATSRPAPSFSSIEHSVIEHSVIEPMPAVPSPPEAANPVRTVMNEPQPSVPAVRAMASLRELFAPLLGVSEEEIDPQVPFIEMGADSIALIQAIRSLEAAYGIKLTVRQMFEELRTLRGLAEFLAPHLGEEEPASLPAVGATTCALPSSPAVVPPAVVPPEKERSIRASKVPPENRPSISSSEVPPEVERVVSPESERSVSSLEVPPEGTGRSVSSLKVPPEYSSLPPEYSSLPAPQAPQAPTVSGGLDGVVRHQLDAFTRLAAEQLRLLGAAGQPVMVQTAPAVTAPPETTAKSAPPAVSSAPVERPTTEPTAEAERPYVAYKPVGAWSDSGLEPRQQKHLQELIDRYTERTARSKQLTQAYRSPLADNRASVGFRPTIKEMLYPVIGERSEGARIWDVDGNEYIDTAMGFGVNLFGHRPPFIQEVLHHQLDRGIQLGPQSELAGDVAQRIHQLTGAERVAFSNSGTEAVMTALRVARTATGRDKIALFAGSYHGHFDGVLAISHPGKGIQRAWPMAPGVPGGIVEDLMVLDYGDPRSLEILAAHADELAGVLVEPVQSRRPDFQPREFLQQLRALTAEKGMALIFDEVITGFRVGPGGAQAHFGVDADIATYGKVIGGGMPIGLLGGKAAFMDAIDGGMWSFGDGSYPRATTTFFAGTFSKHPLAMAAAQAVLRHLEERGPGLQAELNARTSRMVERLNHVFAELAAPIKAINFSSLFRFVYKGQGDLFFYHLMEHGVHTWEGRTCFLSTAHGDAEIEHIVRAAEKSVRELQRGGFLPQPKRAPTRRSDRGSGGAPGANGSSGPSRDVPEPVVAARADAAPEQVTRKARRGFWGAAITDERRDFERLGSAHQAADGGGDGTVDFSLYFFGHYDAEYRPDKYDLLFDCARYADQHGFAALWFPERHFHAFGGLSPNPSVLAAALARETERIQLRAGSVVLPLHHPVRVAEEWALVDNLSGGRVGLAIATGWHARDFSLAPHNFGRHRELMFEQIATVKELWQGKSIEIPSGTGDPVEVAVFPRPSRSELDVWVTVVSNPETYHQAGQIGARVLTNLMAQTPEGLAENIAIYRQALAEAGHPPEVGGVTVLLHTYVEDDAEAAIESARQPFYRYLESSVGLLKNMVATQGMEVDYDELSAEDRDYLMSLAYERYVKTSALIGSPESVAPIVERLRGLGVDEIACLIDFGVDRERVVASLPSLDRLRRLFAPDDDDPDGGRRRRDDEDSVADQQRMEVEAEAPLSLQQRELWALSQLGPEARRAYNVELCLRLDGPLDVDLLARSWRKVATRHEALRTVFAPDGRRQLVLRHPRADLPLVDLSRLAKHHKERAARAAIAAFRDRELDMERGPLLRLVLFRLTPEEHLLELSRHHIVADGWSQSLLFDEVAALYAAALEERPATLPEALPYRAFVADQINRLRGEEAKALESWWLERLAPPLPVLELPTDRLRQAAQTYRGGILHRLLDGQLIAALRAAGAKRGSTLFMVLLAGFRALLHRLSGAAELITVVPTEGQLHAGMTCLMGDGLELLPLRSRAADPLFGDYLESVRRVLLDAFDHQGYPLAALSRQLGSGGDASRWPLFNLDREGVLFRLPGVATSIFEVPGLLGYTNVDLTLDAHPLGGALYLTFEYKSELFDRVTVARFMGHLETLLRGVVDRPEARLSELPLLSPGQHHQLAVEWPSLTSTVVLESPALPKDTDELPLRPARTALDPSEGLPGPPGAEAPPLERKLSERGSLKEDIGAMKWEGEADSSVARVLRLQRGRLGPRGPGKPVRPATMLEAPAPIGVWGELRENDDAKESGRRARRRADGTIEEPSQTKRAGKVRAILRTPTQERLATLWCEVLRLPEVGAQDNFFELGGHSLLATQLISRLRDAFAVELPLSRVLRAATLAELADEVDRARHDHRDLPAPPPLVPVPRDRPLALSFSQQRLWFLDQLTAQSPIYNMPVRVDLHHRVSGTEPTSRVAALAASLAEVVRRHESLRTTYAKLDGEPVQIVAPAAELPLPVIDLTDLAPRRRRRELSRLSLAESRRPFALDTGPLFRATLIILEDGEERLLLNMHHIVSDGWSMVVFLRELGALYDACRQGHPSPLPEPRLQYVDFAAWQRSWFQGPVLAAQIDFWRKRLSPLPPRLELPLDRPRPAALSFSGARQTVRLDPDLSERLRGLGRSAGGTTFTTLFAVYAALLARYAHVDDLAIGAPIAGRGRVELEELIGFFVNTLVLRLDLAGDPGFGELLERSCRVAFAAFDHQDLPYERLVQELNPERYLSHNPLFQVSFAVEDEHIALDLEDVSLRLIDARRAEQIADPPPGWLVDLSLVVLDGEKGLKAAFEYSPELFEDATIGRLLGHFATLVRGAVAEPERPLSALPLLTPGEERQLLSEWNDTAGASSPRETLGTLFDAARAAAEERVAAVFDAEHLSYGELDRRANRLAHRLRRLGVGPDSLVGLYLPRSMDGWLATLAVIKAGGAYLPLDLAYPPERIGFMLEDARPQAILSLTSLATTLPKIQGTVLCLDDEAPRLLLESETAPAVTTDPRHLAYVIYSSGSTGRPKGIAIPQRAVARLVMTTDYVDLGADDRVGQASNTSFDAATFELWGAWLNGGALVGLAQDTVLSPRGLTEAIAAERLSTLFLTTALFNAIARQTPRAFSTLDSLLFGGEAVDPRWVATVLDKGPPRRLLHVYGPTENTTYTTWHPVRGVATDARTVPIGGPMRRNRTLLVGPRLELVPVGVIGQLMIGGDGLARGYVERPALTAERFVPDPHGATPGERLYATGDLVRQRDDGAIVFIGRIDHQIKLRGFRIELGEIEALLGEHPALRQAIVLLRQDAPGEKRLVAYIVPRETGGDAVPAVGELRAHLSHRLPEYMLPSAFVVLGELPLNPNGKVDRDALPAPEAERVELGGDFIAPRTDLEKRLAAVWSEVLGVEHVGVGDNFFELGGDSILAIQLLARSAKAGITVNTRQLFEHQTIGELAAALGDAPGQVTRAVSKPVSGPVPLLPIQRWFCEQNLAAPEHFNMSLLLRARRPLDPARLAAAVVHLLRHHDALRLKLARRGFAWQLSCADLDGLGGAAPSVPTVDLSALAEIDRGEQRQLVAEAFQGGFDLTSGRLLRGLVFRAGAAEELLLVAHHLAVDWVSWQILLDDLMTAYQQLEGGGAVDLGARTTSIATWAELLREHAQSLEAQDELEQWLDGEPGAVLPPRSDEDLARNVHGTTRDVAVTFDEDESAALIDELPGRLGVELRELLLTALTRALTRRAGVSAVRIELEGHGREALGDADLSRTVGWLTALYPLVFEAPPSASPGDVLLAVRERLRRVRRQGLHFGLLRAMSDERQGRRKLRALPEPEVAFNFLGRVDMAQATEDALFELTGELGDTACSRRNRRPHRLQVTALVRAGRLHVNLFYSAAVDERQEIEGLAAELVGELQTLVAHARSASADRFTPASLTTFGWALGEIESVRPHLDAAVVADAYPLSPLQEGFLFHAVDAPRLGLYHQQLSCLLDGPLDADVFTAAWRRAAEHHAVLRTAFFWRAGREPLQIVRREIELDVELHDLRQLASAERDAHLAAFLDEHRQRPFALDEAPLMRLALLRIDDERHAFVWSHHHIILDGWSAARILLEVFQLYDAAQNGTPLELVSPSPFRDYIAWLKRREGGVEHRGDERYWRRALAGFEAPSVLGEEGRSTAEGSETVELELTHQATARLMGFAERHKLTVNTVLQGAWGLLLTRLAGRDDVVFGATVSGRPPELAGVESMVGLFINTLPVRVRLGDAATVVAWLAGLQAEQAEQRLHEASSLAEIQAWSEVPRGQPLFESQLAFENYPVDAELTDQGRCLVIREADARGQTHFPVTLIANPGPPLRVRLECSRRRFDRAAAERLRDQLLTVLVEITTRPEARPQELEHQSPAERREAEERKRERAVVEARKLRGIRRRGVALSAAGEGGTG